MLKQQAAELQREVSEKLKAVEAGTITVPEFTAYMQKAGKIDTEISEGLKAYRQALGFGAGAGSGRHESGAIPGQPYTPGGPGGAQQGVITKAARWQPATPLAADAEQWKSLFMAAKQRVPGYTVQIGGDMHTKALGSWGLQTKDTALAPSGEGAPGSLLPSGLLPQAFGLPLEPDRIFSHFLGETAETQMVTYLQHTGNANPAKTVSELSQKTDLQMSVTPKTVTFKVIAALASFSRQLLDDFSDFYSFVPGEVYRAVIDAESDQVLNGDGTTNANGTTEDNLLGILNVSGLLTRAKGTDSYIDALVKGFNDIRVGSAYGTADRIIMHPTTWTLVRTQKASTGAYLLAALNASDVVDVNDVFGVPVLQTTKCPIGTAIAFDSSKAVRAWTRQALEMQTNQFGDFEFQHNAVTFRVEERVGVGVVFPSAINVITGLE
jgi:hypothetical protein